MDPELIKVFFESLTDFVLNTIIILVVALVFLVFVFGDDDECTDE